LVINYPANCYYSPREAPSVSPFVLESDLAIKALDTVVEENSD